MVPSVQLVQTWIRFQQAPKRISKFLSSRTRNWTKNAWIVVGDSWLRWGEKNNTSSKAKKWPENWNRLAAQDWGRRSVVSQAWMPFYLLDITRALCNKHASVGFVCVWVEGGVSGLFVAIHSFHMLILILLSSTPSSGQIINLATWIFLWRAQFLLKQRKFHRLISVSLFSVLVPFSLSVFFLPHLLLLLSPPTTSCRIAELWSLRLLLVPTHYFLFFDF